MLSADFCFLREAEERQDYNGSGYLDSVVAGRLSDSLWHMGVEN